MVSAERDYIVLDREELMYEIQYVNGIGPLLVGRVLALIDEIAITHAVVARPTEDT